jgi:hypothetical protein
VSAPGEDKEETAMNDARNVYEPEPIESLDIVDLGDAVEQTKQLPMPTSLPDSAFHLGRAC